MRDMSRMPDFFVIGAAKCGTTSLWRYLDQHHDIFMCNPKEPNFMAWGEQPWTDVRPTWDTIVKRGGMASTLESYCALFSAAAPKQCLGDASVTTIYAVRSAARIKQYAPHAKLIAILRQPADRAFSHFVMNMQSGDEPARDFRKALALEADRIQKGWGATYHYRRQGYYTQQLTRFYELFDSRQVKVFLYDDLVAAPLSFVQSMYRFLEVDDTFAPDMSKRLKEGGSWPVNVSLVRFLAGNRFTKALREHSHTVYQSVKPAARRVLIKRAHLAPDLRAELTHGYREEIQRLQDMIGRDLTHWLKPATETVAQLRG